ncbi:MULTISPECIES: DoxX family protein [unclassified Cellulophaga]|uniref:DoxX family protein n=1 Tax=unclassified Cellulophaga TaxID=2634405 RepID=UPI0026E300E5|nr:MULTISPECIES: MauE/DoxX family redox-associated membrane protein [unclassified Cellulophaga]MDO6492477.1 DoxX family membrane protein [Cellulophaga sp. 2_MG-2023]MDO6493579.1 DoxX family membrane protein [Cellulophaga sp. 3_MG-2023]
MKLIWNILKVLLAIFMIYAGLQHFMNPEFFNPYVPDVLVFKTFIIYASGVLEVGLGILLLVPKFASKAAFFIFILMLLFLPIHIWDVFSETPAIGNHQAALIRLPIQLVLIALSYKLYKTNA